MMKLEFFRKLPRHSTQFDDSVVTVFVLLKEEKEPHEKDFDPIDGVLVVLYGCSRQIIFDPTKWKAKSGVHESPFDAPLADEAPRPDEYPADDGDIPEGEEF